MRKEAKASRRIIFLPEKHRKRGENVRNYRYLTFGDREKIETEYTARTATAYGQDGQRRRKCFRHRPAHAGRSAQGHHLDRNTQPEILTGSEDRRAQKRNNNLIYKKNNERNYGIQLHLGSRSCQPYQTRLALARESTPSHESPVDAPVKMPTWKGFPAACSASAILAASPIELSAAT